MIKILRLPHIYSLSHNQVPHSSAQAAPAVLLYCLFGFIMICGNIFQSPLNFSTFLKNTLIFIKQSTGICSLENRRRSRTLLAGPETVTDAGRYFHLVSHVNIYLQRHSLALLCSQTVVRPSSFSETCTACPT